MSTVVKLHMAGFRALRFSPGVMSMLDGHAQRIASAAGEGFEAKPNRSSGKRPRVAVVATTWEANHAEVQRGVLSSAAGGKSVWR